MPNRGGFSWKRLSGYSAAKANISRRTGVPLTRSGRQRKIGRMVGGCLIPILLALFALLIAAPNNQLPTALRAARRQKKAGGHRHRLTHHSPHGHPLSETTRPARRPNRVPPTHHPGPHGSGP